MEATGGHHIRTAASCLSASAKPDPAFLSLCECGGARRFGEDDPPSRRPLIVCCWNVVFGCCYPFLSLFFFCK